jgi:hypothetical protein
VQRLVTQPGQVNPPPHGAPIRKPHHGADDTPGFPRRPRREGPPARPNAPMPDSAPATPGPCTETQHEPRHDHARIPHTRLLSEGWSVPRRRGKPARRRDQSLPQSGQLIVMTICAALRDCRPQSACSVPPDDCPALRTAARCGTPAAAPPQPQRTRTGHAGLPPTPPHRRREEGT